MKLFQFPSTTPARLRVSFKDAEMSCLQLFWVKSCKSINFCDIISVNFQFFLCVAEREIFYVQVMTFATFSGREWARHNCEVMRHHETLSFSFSRVSWIAAGCFFRCLLPLEAMGGGGEFQDVRWRSSSMFDVWTSENEEVNQVIMIILKSSRSTSAFRKWCWWSLRAIPIDRSLNCLQVFE